MSNDIIDVIKTRVKMFDETKMLDHDECRALLLLVEEIEQEYTKEERTCRQVDVTRTCQPYVTHMTVCSICREILAIDEYPAPNYCPSCGSKVKQ